VTPAAAAKPAVAEDLVGDEIFVILKDPNTVQRDPETLITWLGKQVHKTRITRFVGARLGTTLREAKKSEITAWAAREKELVEINKAGLERRMKAKAEAKARAKQRF